MIQAEIIADSLSPQGNRLTTFIVTFPRIVLAEFNTHRMFSRNSASSRAIPFKKMAQMVQENPFIPIAWQKDHKGMQGTKYLEVKEGIYGVENHWLAARDKAIGISKVLNKNGVTKQLCNRLLEPFMWHKVIVTSSEEGLENFFKLRCPQYEDPSGKLFRSRKEYSKHSEWDNSEKWNDIDWFGCNKSQAEIHIQALAECMWDVYNESTPKKLEEGEWHIPFGDNFDHEELVSLHNRLSESKEPIIKNMLKIAVARCARISYQTLGDNPVIDYERDLQLFERLKKSEHWSPFEHVARAMKDQEYYSTHKYQAHGQNGWCRNFKGFIQYRALID